MSMAMQCKDIPDQPIIEWLNQNTDSEHWATWGKGYSMPTVADCMPEGTPPKLQLAKMKKLIDKGLVNGCACGCRGDFYIDANNEKRLRPKNQILR